MREYLVMNEKMCCVMLLTKREVTLYRRAGYTVIEVETIDASGWTKTTNVERSMLVQINGVEPGMFVDDVVNRRQSITIINEQVESIEVKETTTEKWERNVKEV